MATERQIEANRQNALSSTGPRSDAGKARSATNAIMHGFTARRALLPGEDAEMLDTLNRLMVDKFGPHGPYEADLVATAASLIWRLRDELIAARDKFKAKAAAGVITDVRTGEILAMVSVPDFDPNNPKEASDPKR